MPPSPDESHSARMAAAHGGPSRRDGVGVPHDTFFQPGLFGRMFPKLAPLETTPADLIALGEAMTEPAEQVDQPAHDNKTIPSGYTYLGQFIDHDVTFDTTPPPERAVDPFGLRNFRTPKLDLDSLYGLGPSAQPYLYERADPRKFLLGKNAPSQDAAGKPIGALPNDLLRNGEGRALIGDPRNDENLIVAQLHLAFLKFHNKVAETQPALSFDDVRRIVTWHYQWIVVHDFLPRIADSTVVDDVLASGPIAFQFEGEPYMPVEFSAAAYRLHTMIRENYDYNRVFGPGPGRVSAASLGLLFRFTGFSSDGRSVPVPSNWVIDWRRFFPIDGHPPANHSRRMDAQLTPALSMLDGPDPAHRRLAVKNLLRGQAFGLPSGQDVALELNLGDQILTPHQIAAAGADGKVAAAKGYDSQSPLWYYALKEAEILGKGEHLGPVGSRIVAEVLIGLLLGDQRSYLSRHPSFRPSLPSKKAGTFTMADLLSFVAEVNPLG